MALGTVVLYLFTLFHEKQVALWCCLYLHPIKLQIKFSDAIQLYLDYLIVLLRHE